MLIYLYNFVWLSVLVFAVPILLFCRKEEIAGKLALAFPSITLQEGNIWIHALSVGEVISAVPLVEAIARKFPERDIVFTVTTSRGMAVAREKLEGRVKALLLMPLDFCWCVYRIFNYIRPSVFILVETDIWPGLPAFLKKKGIITLLVNGRVSPHTFKAYRRMSFFTRKLFEPINLCLMQSDLDRQRLLRAGVRPEEKVITVGNIKFDRQWVPMNNDERSRWMNILGLQPEDLIWVAGSTHSGEEEILLNAFRRLRPLFPNLRLIIAPRKIEQSEEIFKKARLKGFKAVLKTEIKSKGSTGDVFILNTMGELDRIYGLSQISFVGGSLVPVGGHNLLEPAAFGCPVLFGPYMHNFALMSELLLESGGGIQVKNEKELYDGMSRILAHAEMRHNMSRQAKEFAEKNRGAIEEIISYITHTMTEQTAFPLQKAL
ncbi:MAG: 3-deoxy-D-manno-octulosonic acid transferase [Deltaproteobacteria bacterium]|nr:3-deoxy-D-manno-octulosonic acid transferase [Deltaproteobacteria bacterium]